MLPTDTGVATLWRSVILITFSGQVAKQSLSVADVLAATVFYDCYWPHLCPLYYSRHVGSLPSRFRPCVVNLLGRPWPSRWARSQQNIDINPSRHHLQSLPHLHRVCLISNFSTAEINRQLHHLRIIKHYSILLSYSARFLLFPSPQEKLLWIF